MKNRTEDTTMREEVNEDSELFVAVVLLLVVDTSIEPGTTTDPLPSMVCVISRC